MRLELSGYCWCSAFPAEDCDILSSLNVVNNLSFRARFVKHRLLSPHTNLWWFLFFEGAEDFLFYCQSEKKYLCCFVLIISKFFFTNCSRRENKSLGFEGLKTRQGRSVAIYNNLKHLKHWYIGPRTFRRSSIQPFSMMTKPWLIWLIPFSVNPSLSFITM